MTPDGAPLPHQTLHGSPGRIWRFYYQCGCGYLRGRNARSTCSHCGRPPSSWSRSAVRAYRAELRRRVRFWVERDFHPGLSHVRRQAWSRHVVRKELR